QPAAASAGVNAFCAPAGAEAGVAQAHNAMQGASSMPALWIQGFMAAVSGSNASGTHRCGMLACLRDSASFEAHEPEHFRRRSVELRQRRVADIAEILPALRRGCKTADDEI